MKHFRPAATILLLVAATVLVWAAPALAGSIPMTDIPYDATPYLKNVPAPHQNYPTTVPNSALAAGVRLQEGPPDLVLTLNSSDPANPETFDVPFWKEYEGAHSDIYVGWDDLDAPPASSQQDQTITADQIAYLGQEFDERIWESDVFHFGNYEPRAPLPGMDGTRAAVFVYNIRDEAYYSDYPFYTVGYFSARLSEELKLNAIWIDSYDWANRLGADVAIPRLMESTIAHEFQHLIHQDVDGNESDFINEGMADMAEQFLYGTLTTDSHIGYYMLLHRDALVTWNGVALEDYGSSVLWQDYLWEQAGGADLLTPLADRVAPGYENDKFAETADKFSDPGDKFVWNLIHDQATGMASIANRVGGMDKVEELFRDWTLANLLDGRVKEPQWNYRNLALGGPDSAYYRIEDGIAYYQSNVNGNMPPTRKNVRRRTVTEPWGAYYRTFGGSEPGFYMNFVGTPTSGVAPYTGAYEWFSSGGNMLKRSLSRQIDNVAPGSTLSFWTWFDIEDQWDYGYVEASADGVNWTKLTQTSTLPMATADLNGSSAWDGPGGLTGNSGGWQLAEFSMGDFSGNVWIRFRYNTDDAVNGAGWYIDDITLGAFSDTVESEIGWATDGWLFTNGIQNNDWTADAYVPYLKDRRSWFKVQSIVGTEGQGIEGRTWVNAQYLKNGKAWGIVSNHPDGTFATEGRLTIKKGKSR